MYKTETPNWHLSMAERHVEKLSQENEALREALQLKELECEALAGDKEAMKAVLVECMDALEMSYDVNEYPANGKTPQDAAAAKASKVLNELGGGDEQQAD